MNSRMMMAAVPVSLRGYSLNARMYPMPTTVPGTANVSSETSSISLFPGKFFRTTRKAMIIASRPAVGVAMAESRRVSLMYLQPTVKT